MWRPACTKMTACLGFLPPRNLGSRPPPVLTDIGNINRLMALVADAVGVTLMWVGLSIRLATLFMVLLLSAVENSNARCLVGALCITWWMVGKKFTLSTWLVLLSISIPILLRR